MKKIIPLMALMFLAGCGNNSTENQSGSANPPASEQAPNPAETNLPAAGAASGNGSSSETATNHPAANTGTTTTNAPAGTNQN